MPLEQRICIAAVRLQRRGHTVFHGYEMAKSLAEESDARLLTAYGTLYRALARLEEMGLLSSRPEDPGIAAREGRPGRRLYMVTTLGEEAATEARRALAAAQRRRRPRRRLATA